jgi:hypothetical protein
VPAEALHGAPDAIDRRRHRDIQRAGDILVSRTLRAQPQALALHFRQARDVLRDQARLFLIEHLALGIGRRVGVFELLLVLSVALKIAPAVDQEIPRHAKQPGADLVHLLPIGEGSVQAGKCFLGDIIGERLRAPRGAQVAENGIAKLDPPALDFSGDPDRVGI